MTHTLKSFIETTADCDFSIHNIPFGMYKSAKRDHAHACTAIGDCIVDLSVLERKGILKVEGHTDIFHRYSLNDFFALDPEVVSKTRKTIQELLSADNATLRDDNELRERVFKKISDVTMVLPMKIGDYTDFYSSEEHATNVGKMFRPNADALLPNWKHLPVGYHGRASSVVASGQDLHRPWGQVLLPSTEQPIFSPCKRLDFELEMAFFVGQGNALGKPISVHDAKNHIAGIVLMNDWSARDIQKWEYVPLGPFGAKNFGTSISPWIVTLDALEPFKTKMRKQEPQPLAYLQQSDNTTYDIELEVSLTTAKMPEPHVICRSNFKHLYWSMQQQLAHHTVTGCNMQSGDLLASGTISGPDKTSFGSMLELSWGGKEAIQLPSGETRTFLEDGDTVIMRAWAQKGDIRVGLGEVAAKVLPAVEPCLDKTTESSSHVTV